MKRRKATGDQDELRPEYDLCELLRHAVRGKYAARYRQGTNLVLLDPAIARAFPTDAAVNEALASSSAPPKSRRAVTPTERNPDLTPWVGR